MSKGAGVERAWHRAVEQATGSRSFAVTRQWGQVRAAFDREFAPALSNDKPVPDAMRAAKTAIDQILAGAAKQ